MTRALALNIILAERLPLIMNPGLIGEAQTDQMW
jgi:hypothetical protein